MVASAVFAPRSSPVNILQFGVFGGVVENHIIDGLLLVSLTYTVQRELKESRTEKFKGTVNLIQSNEALLNSQAMATSADSRNK